MCVLPVRTPQDHSLPRLEVNGPKQDAFGVAARHRHFGLCPPQRPGTTKHGKEPEHGLVLTQEDRRGGSLPQFADYGPFFCARWGACSSEQERGRLQRNPMAFIRRRRVAGVMGQ